MHLFEDIFSARKDKKNGFVLALGGGGGRGLAHLGVLEVLEEHKLRPDAIVGSSIGALFGAMYALNPDAKAVTERAMGILTSDAYNSLELPALSDDSADQSWLAQLSSMAKQTVLMARAATGRSIAETGVLLDIVHSFCEGSFKDLHMPIYITAVQFPSGDCHLFNVDSQVDLTAAIAASMAIPGVFEPLSIAGVQYVDGGVASELPAKEARMVAASDQLVVAVNVGARPIPDQEPTNVYGMRDWSAQIQSLYLRRYSKQYADVVIEPLVSFTQWHDFSNPEQEIEKGRQAALEMMPALIKKLAG